MHGLKRLLTIVARKGVSALEPCSFHGRTPSRAKALIEPGVSEVYISIPASDPRNNGKGIPILKSSGIIVAEEMAKKTG